MAAARAPLFLASFSNIFATGNCSITRAGIITIETKYVLRFKSVNDVAKSDKLVELRVNFGHHVRTVLAGMKRERATHAKSKGNRRYLS